MKNMTITIKVNKERNLEVLNPLMKKGGVHQKDNKVSKSKKERRQGKHNLKKEGW